MALMKKSSGSCMSRTSCSNNYYTKVDQCHTPIALLTLSYLGKGYMKMGRQVEVAVLTDLLFRALHNYYCLSYLCLRYTLCVRWFTLVFSDINCTCVSRLLFCCKCHRCLEEPHRIIIIIIAKSIRHTLVLFCVLCNDYCCSYSD